MCWILAKNLLGPRQLVRKKKIFANNDVKTKLMSWYMYTKLKLVQLELLVNRIQPSSSSGKDSTLFQSRFFDINKTINLIVISIVEKMTILVFKQWFCSINLLHLQTKIIIFSTIEMTKRIILCINDNKGRIPVNQQLQLY